jgi:hypothetical protein
MKHVLTIRTINEIEGFILKVEEYKHIRLIPCLSRLPLLVMEILFFANLRFTSAGA